ncbi:hypothetical protein CBER1_05960 [Cercospora berteroae]|uniref:Uncharacterized protein n=1 Tax=Cercospora berteroae TaxID=357750 RepID=A0A2S6CAS3_9PEZI|nr:hypothetical protein CBER1_05960 [Cercospora berteroae]
MASDQYVRFTFVNESRTPFTPDAKPQSTFQLRFPHTGWPGYLFQPDNLMDRPEISHDELAKQTIEPGGRISFGHTTDRGLFSEAKGVVEIWSEWRKGNKIEYSLPWDGDNELKVTDKGEDWEIEEPGWGRRGGIGDLVFLLRKKE